MWQGQTKPLRWCNANGFEITIFNPDSSYVPYSSCVRRAHIITTRGNWVGFHFEFKSKFSCDMSQIRQQLLQQFVQRHGTWWRHQVETFSALLVLCVGNSPVTGEFPSQRPVTRNCDVYLICACTNSCANNGDADDLRCHPAHYDVTVMKCDMVVWGHYMSIKFDGIFLHKLYRYTYNMIWMERFI